MEEKENSFDKHIIGWTAPEYIQHEKGLKWFIVAGIFILILVVYGILADNWTLSVALVLASAVYVMVHGQTPRDVKVVVSKTGIKFGDREYPYQNIKYFWIVYNPPKVKTLNLKTNSRFLPDVTIQLGDQDPAELRTFLLMHIRELEGKEENWVDALLRILKL